VYLLKLLPGQKTISIQVKLLESHLHLLHLLFLHLLLNPPLRAEAGQYGWAALLMRYYLGIMDYN
jgi:hypothetical protein